MLSAASEAGLPKNLGAFPVWFALKAVVSPNLVYPDGRNFGHLAYAMDNIYDTFSASFGARGVTINRPPRTLNRW
jgi:hypothetical protein